MQDNIKFYKEIKCETWGELQLELQQKKKYLFRGVKNISYKLVPSLLRTCYEKTNQEVLKFEIQELKKFYRCCNQKGLYIPDVKFFSEDYFLDDFEWIKEKICRKLLWDIENWYITDKNMEFIELAQHYDVPTRLLDWTQDSDIALYFACENQSDLSQDKAIWAIDMENFYKVKYYRYVRPEYILNENYGKRKLLGILAESDFPLNFYVPGYYRNQNAFAQIGVLSLWKPNLLAECLESTTCIRELASKSINEIINFLEERLEIYFQKKVKVSSLDELLGQYMERKDINKYIIFYKFIISRNMTKEIQQYLESKGINNKTIYSNNPYYSAVYSKGRDKRYE